jgi:nicotinamidase-related amidase
MHTAADAFYHGYKLIVPSDCVTAFNVEDHNIGLRFMRELYGAEIVNSRDVLKRWGIA